jgi:ATP-dependent Clp protease adaptor protein ClpS
MMMSILRNIAPAAAAFLILLMASCSLRATTAFSPSNGVAAASSRSAFIATTRRACPFPSSSLSSRSGVAPLGAAGADVIEAPPVKEVETQEKKNQNEQVTEKKNRQGTEAWEVRLYNDPMNKREFVARCLSRIVGLSDTQSFQVMMTAHKLGIAAVGRFHLERAETYRNALREQGLSVDMVPVDDE